MFLVQSLTSTLRRNIHRKVRVLRQPEPQNVWTHPTVLRLFSPKLRSRIVMGASSHPRPTSPATINPFSLLTSDCSSKFAVRAAPSHRPRPLIKKDRVNN